MAKKPSGRTQTQGPTGGSPDRGAARLLDDIARKVERTIAGFVAAWRQKFKHLIEEELHRYGRAEMESFPTLATEFAGRGVNYEQDILPVFRERWKNFAILLCMRKATEEAVQEYQRWLKRYERAVRLLTEEAAPFTQEVKELLQSGYSLFPRPGHVRDMLVQEIQKFSREHPGGELLADNVKKSAGKHPAWRQLQVELFKILTAKGVTERQSFRLISQLFAALIPPWFDAKHGPDAVRLNVKARLKAQRRA